MLVRDYAEGDLAQARFAAAARQQRLGANFYARGDGTRAYYFSEARVLCLLRLRHTASKAAVLQQPHALVLAWQAMAVWPAEDQGCYIF